MAVSRLDPRAEAKVAGPAWRALRPTFDRLNAALLAVSPTVRGCLTTIYIKYSGPETMNQSYAVLWIRRSTDLTLGLALPEDAESSKFIKTPPGCTYAGLTRYLVIHREDGIPAEFNRWAERAYRHVIDRSAASS